MTDNPTVFVVDDDSAAAASVAALMTSVGLNSKLFDSAESFLDIYDGSQQGCLVLDLRLRGMNGLELHKTLLERGFSMPTILISGHIDSQTRDQAQQQSVIACLEKPYSGRDLCALVQSALSQE